MQAAATVIGKLVQEPAPQQDLQHRLLPAPASVNDLAAFAKGRADKITLAKVTLPPAIGGVGVLVALSAWASGGSVVATARSRVANA